MMECPQEIVHTVLKSHHANEANECFCFLLHSRVRLNRAATLNLDAIAYDGDTFYGHVVAFHLDLFVGLVGGDDVVGDHASKPLQCEEGSVNDRRATVRKTGTIHLWGQIVMVEDKTLAEQFVESGDKYKGIGWIMGMHNVEALAHEHKQRYCEGCGRAIAVFPKVAQETVHRRWRSETINANVVHGLAPALALGRRTNDRNTVTRHRQC